MTKYICNLRTYSGNSDDTLDLIENRDIIANSIKQVEQYINEEYDTTGYSDLGSDSDHIIIGRDYKAWCSDHGNVHEVIEECEECNKAELENDDLCSDHFWYSEQIDCYCEVAKKADLEYIKSDKYYKTVVDLTS